MMKRLWNRRDLLSASGKAAMGMAIAEIPVAHGLAQQLPPPEPLTDSRITLVTTTEAKPWQQGKLYKPSFQWDMLNLNVGKPDLAAGDHTMEGFGGCFNELGWTSLQALNEQDRDSILHELFHPRDGARFNYCRMPIGANDYATEAYSYDEHDGDFDMQHFSIDHDRNTLIPFIHAAQKYQPELKLWASPWSPPTWMKRNHFYAEAAAFPGFKENGIRPDQIGKEGEDMFIQEPRYFEAYARYFGHFIDAYREQGIHVGMVMPQNEFNSAQNFPSCTWTAEGLARFIAHLGPEMSKRDVQIFFGTLERGNPKLLETVMADPKAANYVKGFSTQWAGKGALPALHREFPALLLYQSEQECGDGTNSWSYTLYCWQLMKHYFRSGACAYMYWNISTAHGGMSTWGWPQNSLVTVDAEAKTFRYNHDYYLMKHLTHFVDIGARSVEVTGTCDDAIGFLNPDKTVVLLLQNPQSRPQLVQVQAEGTVFAAELAPDSLNTLTIKPS